MAQRGECSGDMRSMGLSFRQCRGGAKRLQEKLVE
jgi:hypothetical protein